MTGTFPTNSTGYMFAQFTVAGLGKTGLTVTVSVNNPDFSNLVSVASATHATELDAVNQPGWYYYGIVNSGTQGQYQGTFTTSDTTVDRRSLPATIEFYNWVAYVNGAGGNLNSGKTGYSLAADQAVNATKWAGQAIPTPTVTGVPKVDMVDLLGTAVSTPATAGILDVNTKNVNNVPATSVTTVNANQGTTQPVNFTGTAASALVKGDTVDIAGTASAGAAGYVGTDQSKIANPTSTVALTGTTVGVATDVTTKTGYALSTAGILAIWNQLTNDVGIIAGSFGAFLNSLIANTWAGVTQAFFAKFFTQDSGKTYTDAVAGSVVKETASNATASTDTSSFSGAAKTEIDAIKAKTDHIGDGTVTVVSPYNPVAQTLTFIKGDSYTLADGFDILITVSGYPDFTGGTVLCENQNASNARLSTINASLVGTNQIRLEPTSAQTQAIESGKISARITLAAGAGIVTPFLGNTIVITAPTS